MLSFFSRERLRPLIFLVAVAVSSSVPVGCDTVGTKNPNPPVNPYMDVTDIHSEAAMSAIAYAKSHPSQSSQQIRDKVAEGYRQWVNEHKSRAESAFEGFQEFYDLQQSVQQHIARTPHVKSARSLPVDSLLSAADLSSAQRDRIKTLLSLPKKVDSFSQIESRLDQFDRNTVQNLEEREQKVVLQMSALLRAQVDVIERLSASEVAELFDQTGSTDAVFLKDDDDRPEWNEFYSEEDIITAGTSMGLTVGGTAAGSCTAVAVICGVSFGAGGAVAGAAWEYSSQYDEYQTQLRDWCEESGNSHSSCQDDLP